MNPEPIIQFEQVSFAYNGTPVLHGVNLALRHGDFACVLGPNGGGKTTLVKLMLGLLRPQAGRVLVLGEPPQEVLKRIGYMPQRTQFDPRFPVTVLDVTLMGRLGRSPWIGPYRTRDKQLALQALTEVGMADLVRRPLASLSGGQRQRVLIARALACDPEILILDEPMAGLDPAAQEDLYGLLGKLNQRLTIVMVSHDIGFVSLYFNTVVCVDRHVHVHPAGELTGKRIADMYGREVRLLHDGLAKNTKPPAGGTP